jgi:tRNA(adenine34) deaminase
MADSTDEGFMRHAIALAQAGQEAAGGSPIGCVIVLDGRIIGQGHNQTEGDHDPTAHAEVVAMRRAGAAVRNWELRGATLYSTLQPCGMCTMASIWAKIGRIVYGAGRGDVHSMYFEDRHLDTDDFIRDAYRRDIGIEGGVLAADCAKLYYGPGESLPFEEQANI